MPSPLNLDDVIYIFTYVERMAHLMQRTRSNLTIATDTIRWVATALHIPVEPKEQELDFVQKERKAFYEDVIAERNTFNKYASRNRGVSQIPVNQRGLAPLFGMVRYAIAHANAGHPGVVKIRSRLASKGWAPGDVDAYPMWEPSRSHIRQH